MAFFASAIDTLKILVIALGAGLGAWGVVNLLEGYGNDKPCRDLCRKWNDDPLRRPDLLCQHQYKLLAAAFLYIWASALTDWR